MRKALLLTVLLGLCLPANSMSAQAAQFSGSYLRQLCDSDKKGRERLDGGHAVCQSYISGVIDYHNVLQALKVAPKIDICVPSNVTLNQLQNIVLTYLKKNRQHEGFVAAPAVTMALYQYFPCK